MSAWMVGIACLGGACGPSFDTVCDDFNECIDGNEADLDACLNRMDLRAKEASIVGCSEYFDDVVTCFELEGSCDNNAYRAGENNEDCEDEIRAYNSCSGGGAGNVSPIFPSAF